MNFFAELKRRHIYRVAAAYAVVAWVLLQLINNVAPVLDLPVWVARAFLLALVIGFPVAILLAWIRELTPADGTAARATTGKLDWALIGALVVVITLVSYQQLAPATGPRTPQEKLGNGTDGTGGISVAVLPFANLSGDLNQEFFSDGMTDEIMTALAKVSALRVVGRESAYQFKGRKTDMSVVGQALHATYLIEGSVRKAGDQVRITAQLVQADNGVSVWTDSYDREMKNIFATQSDIAQAIAGALRVPLGLAQGDTLVRNHTKDDVAYEDYLRAKALVRGRRGDGLSKLTEAAKLLESVVARDPSYAPAWALLALAYGEIPTYHPAVSSSAIEEAHAIVEASLPKAEAAARRAIQLDGKNPDGYTALGYVQNVRGKFLVAADLYARALALDADNPDALYYFSTMLADLGYVKQALPIAARLRLLEPFVLAFTTVDSRMMWVDGQVDAAIASYKQRVAGVGFAAPLARIYAAQGRYREAADLMQASPVGAYLPGTVETATRLLRSAPATAASPQTLPRLGYLSFVYLYVGAPNRFLDDYEDGLSIGYKGISGYTLLWAQPYASIRKTEQFKKLMRNAGLVDYWRARGWPDLCRPMGANDFVCD